MTIIDSQVHAYEANTPKRPWHTVPNWPDHVTGDEMVAAMDKVGVDGAIFISAFSMYRYDASYAVEVQRAHPGRIAIVKPVDPDDPGGGRCRRRLEEDAGRGRNPHHVTKESKRAPDDPGLDRIARAAVRHDFPVNMLCWDNLDAGTALIDRHPDTRFIIDHLGILQPRVPPAPPEPWADLPKVLELAKRPNAVIKVSGACTLSREPYPFRTSGIRLPACSMPGVSIAACGARTGRARSPSSTTSRPSSPSSRPSRLSDSRAGHADGRGLRQGHGRSPKKG